MTVVLDAKPYRTVVADPPWQTTDALCAVLDIAIRLGDADGTLRLAPTCAAEIKAELQAAAQLRADLAAARAANERDRTEVIKGVNALRSAIAKREWMAEPGNRGCYAWDDDAFKDEFGAAIKELEAALEPLRKIGKDWSHCPTDQGQIAFARWMPRGEAVNAVAVLDTCAKVLGLILSSHGVPQKQITAAMDGLRAQAAEIHRQANAAKETT